MDTEPYAPTSDIVDYHQDGDQHGSVFGAYHRKFFEQSVTLTAKMWPQDNGTAATSKWLWRWGSWRVPSEDLPLFVGIFCGITLVLLLVAVIILWRCCVAPHRNKEYPILTGVRLGDLSPTQSGPVVPVLPSHSAVFANAKCGQWSYDSRLVPNASDTGSSQHWFYNSHVLNLSPGTLECSVPRSVSVPTHQHQAAQEVQHRPPRPLSQPAALTPRARASLDLGPCSLPQISEFNPQGSSLHVSSSVLDHYGSRNLFPPSYGATMLKTRSLPACVRSKARPHSTADDPAELYAKVNFSKKRKNRMRNDEAAIIALSKSRSQFLFKDTDSLVDNEAVVVYDERTAL
ncbi:hypothetical protein LSTR_LSTR004011 [Laodelphax striatellus]|uniref:Uncharacterized protein n=1 Tax=Laodelphax striatellus TaxID=195883 RepID=A0A482WFB4_LAOST|nr:hypothetical protein LSTR_LSTR004011 [Laodelphax striatellus]